LIPIPRHPEPQSSTPGDASAAVQGGGSTWRRRKRRECWLLQRKLDIFETITRTRKKVQWVLITCNGFKPNTWSEDLIDVALDAAVIFGGA
jgi:hypothetical protein